MLVAKTGTVADLMAAFVKKADLEDEATAGPIRFYEINQNKVHRELPHEHLVAGITDYVHVAAERIPKEELEGDRSSILAFHFEKEPSKSHGIPFIFKIIPVGVFRRFLEPLLTLYRMRNSLIPRRDSKSALACKAKTSRR